MIEKGIFLFFILRLFFSKTSANPSIFTGITRGLLAFIIWAVPDLTGLELSVVPLGNVITQPSFKAFIILSKSSVLIFLLISFPASLHVLLINIDPA